MQYHVVTIKIHAQHSNVRYSKNGAETIIFKLEEMLGIVDLRSLGYYKVKQGILQQILNKYYGFGRADKLCEYFNTFINSLKREREQKELKERYASLDLSDERKYMTNQEILDKYICDSLWGHLMNLVGSLRSQFILHVLLCSKGLQSLPFQNWVR